MTARANAYYNLLTGWAAERVRGAAAAGARPFAFGRMAPFRRGMADAPGPCVLFATPGMLHGGQSLDVFKAWAPDPR
jgi:integrator complex subunit 11